MKLKILFFLAFTLILSVKVSALDIPYGKSGKIVYNLPSGTFSVFQNSVLILKSGFSTIKNHDKLISSKDYNQNTYSKINFKDGFGTGVKYTIFLKAKGLPDLKQVFYTYSNRSYFMCELELSGQALSSNQIMPIQGEIVIANKVEKEELRSLYVPFDNDTFISYNTPILKADTIIYSAEVSALYNNISRKGIISGSLEHGNWKTGIKTSEDNHGVISLDVINGYTEKSLTRDDIPHGNISGTIIKSSKIFFGFFKDWRTGMDEFAKANRLVEPPIVFKWNHPTPIGWNSWGVMQGKISFKKASQVVDFFADSLKAFRNEGIAYIDLDSYWDKMIKGGLEGDYSELKAFADYTKKKGLKPGVYWAPFTDWGFKSGANRKAEGSSYTYGEMWTKIGSGFHDFDGARALDPTHPGTQKRIALVIGKLKDCGFEMIKIDFLGHAAVESDHFYNPKITTGMQAYKLGMEYLIKQLDSKMLVYAAISPSLASGRYIHSRRIACDAFKSIKDTEYTLNSVSNGWWQTYLYDYLDADHVVLATETEGANRARMISAVITGTMITGDDFSVDGQWKERAMRLYQNPKILEVIKDGKAFRPIEGDRGKLASEMFIKKSGNNIWLAIFNYENASKTYKINLNRLDLPVDGDFKAEDLINGNINSFNNKSILNVAGGNALILKITK